MKKRLDAWRRPVPKTGSSILALDTPALLLDLDAAEANIAKMARWFRGKSCRLRPHAKTHKLPLIARKQIAAGAIGITCAKLSEAEAFFRHGIRDILLANEVAGPVKIARLMDVARLGNLMVCVDNARNVAEIARAAKKHGLVISILVEVDVGLGRCGVKPGLPALTLARFIGKRPGLKFRGIMGYEGGCFIKDAAAKEAKTHSAYRELIETKHVIERAGIAVEVVTAGGSNTYKLAGAVPGITDLQVGSYVTMDTFNREYGLDFVQSLTVLATVISRPAPDRAIIDAGLKALSTDHGLPIALQKGVAVTRLDEEHGRLALSGPAKKLKIGDKIELVPSHGCTTIPLHEHYVLTRGNRVEGLAVIPARGALF